MISEKQKNDKTPILYILGLVMIWRAILSLFAFVAKNRFSLLPDPGYGKIIPWEAPGHPLLSLFTKWDSGFYLEIAKSGYFYDQAKELYNTIFFPLYPLLIRLLGLVLNDLILTGVMLSFVFAFLACFFLYKIAKLDLDEEGAKRSIFYFLIFPSAIFLAAVYNESLFVFEAAAAFYFSRKNKWFPAGVFGFFAALTRPQGILLLPVLLLEYLEQRNFSLRKIGLGILNLLWIPAGLGLYMYHLQVKFGNAFLFLSQQNFWGRTTQMTPQGGFFTLKTYFLGFFFPQNAPFPEFLIRDTELIFFLVFLVIAFFVFFQFRMSYGIYIFLGIIFPLLTGTLTSIQRYALLLFPAFIFLAKLGKRQSVNFAIGLIFSLFLGLFTILFINWYWAG